jgi:hypothetical protein
VSAERVNQTKEQEYKEEKEGGAEIEEIKFICIRIQFVAGFCYGGNCMGKVDVCGSGSPQQEVSKLDGSC